MNSNSCSWFKPALTKKDLMAIQERGAGSPDVRALLWEVARLRTGAAHARLFPAGVIADRLRNGRRQV